jgi:hypothetical protein
MACIMRPRNTAEEDDPFADLVPVSAPALVSPLEYGSGISGFGGGTIQKAEDTTDQTKKDITSSEEEEDEEEGGAITEQSADTNVEE